MASRKRKRPEDVARRGLRPRSGKKNLNEDYMDGNEWDAARAGCECATVAPGVRACSATRPRDGSAPCAHIFSGAGVSAVPCAGHTSADQLRQIRACLKSENFAVPGLTAKGVGDDRECYAGARGIDKGCILGLFAGRVVPGSQQTPSERRVAKEHEYRLLLVTPEGAPRDLFCAGDVGITRHLLHGCEPSVYAHPLFRQPLDIVKGVYEGWEKFSMETLEGLAVIVFVAARKIKPGERLRFRYNFPGAHGNIECTCGAPLCCKVIGCTDESCEITEVVHHVQTDGVLSTLRVKRGPLVKGHAVGRTTVVAYADAKDLPAVRKYVNNNGLADAAKASADLRLRAPRRARDPQPDAPRASTRARAVMPIATRL